MNEDNRNKYSLFSLLNEHGLPKDRPLTPVEQDRIVRRWRIITFIIALTLLLWGFSLLNSYTTGGVTQQPTYNPIKIFFYGLRIKPFTIIILTAAAYFISYAAAKLKRSQLDEPVIIIDEAGDRVKLGSSVGVRGILTDEEEARIFDLSELDSPTGVPIAINNNTGLLINKVPGLREDVKYHLQNDNILVVGPSGMGKTTGLNLGAAAQHMLLRHGTLIFDPKGDMYPTLKPIDIDLKRRVFLFDFKDGELSHSDGWDCLKQVREADIDTAIQLADTFATIILSKEEEQYWGDAAKNLFKMLLLYVTHGRSYVPPAIRKSSDDSVSIGTGARERRTWRELMNLVTTSSDMLVNIFNEAMDNEDDNELLNDYFTTWSEDKNYSQIRSSLANALDVFKTPAVIDILSSDEIDIDALADGDTSIYVACSGRNDTYMPVLTLFVNTVFQRTMSIAEQNGGSLDHMLFILLEEFYSLGRLDMLPRILSQSRSYNLSTMISTQTTTQLEKYNTKEDRGGGRSSIQSACALQICVGANEGVGSDTDGDTATYFSARAGKKERVDDQITESRFKPLPEEVQAPFQWDQKKRTTNKAEWVYPPDRIQAMTPDEIFISPGPHKCRIQKKYQWSLHPLYGTYAIDRQTGEPVRFLTTEHVPVRKGGKESTVQEYEIIRPKARTRIASTVLAGDTRDENDFFCMD